MTFEASSPQQFSNVQLELLKLYASNLPNEDILKIRDLLANFFAEKAKDAADKAWEEKGLTEERLMSIHQRTPYGGVL